MFIVKLGLRNLFRHKKRTIITAAVISLAILIYLVVDSLMAGFTDLSFNNIINLQSGHLHVVRPEYEDEKERMPLKHLMVFDDQLKDNIQGINHYQALAEELRFTARLNNGIDEMPVTGIGIKVDQYLKVFNTKDYMIKGSMFEENKYKAVIGQSLAELMELNIGDYITLLTRTKGGTFNTIDAEISGLLKTPNPTINNNIVYLPLSIVQQGLNIEKEISRVVVKLNVNKYMAPDIVSTLNNKFKKAGMGVKAYSWKESAKDIIAMSKAQQVETTTVLGIILLIAAVGIINTTILGALERMEEIGMMKALGMKESEIIRAFMVEAAGIGLIGGLIGWVLSAGGVAYLTYIGIPLSDLAGKDMDFGMPIVDTIYGHWNISAFIFIFIFGIVVAILASILPARWAARKDPVKAIYHR